jgi:hypothetical protein
MTSPCGSSIPYLKHYKKYKDWSDIGERAYMQARRLPFTKA